MRLDYLFHKTGALRGKPRGYAFVEYLNDQVSPLAHPLAAREEKGIKRLCSPRVYLFPPALYLSFPLAPRPHIADPGDPPWRQVMTTGGL